VSETALVAVVGNVGTRSRRNGFLGTRNTGVAVQCVNVSLEAELALAWCSCWSVLNR
jgi:hypothetical protein